MQLGTILNEMEVTGDCLKQFAAFGQDADTKHTKGLAHLLEAFHKRFEQSDPLNYTFEEAGIRALTVGIAAENEGASKEMRTAADVIGLLYYHLIDNLFSSSRESKEDIRFFTELLEEASRACGRKPLLAVTREFILEKDLTSKPAAAEIKNEMTRSAKQTGPDIVTQAEMEGAFRSECRTFDICLAIRARIDAGATVEAGRYELELNDDPYERLPATNIQHGGIEITERDEPAESLTNLADTLNAAEEGDGENEAPAISEIDNIERKLKEQKAEGKPLRLSLFVTNLDSLDLTEDEFENVLGTIKRLRDEAVAREPMEWMDLKYRKGLKAGGTRKIHFTMNMYQDGYTDYGVDLGEDDFKAILAGWKANHPSRLQPEGLAADPALVEKAPIKEAAATVRMGPKETATAGA